MNTGLCGFGTLIYFHIDSYSFLKNGALDGAQWSTDNITISPDTSRKKIMDMKTINLDSSKVGGFSFHKKNKQKEIGN